MTGDQIRKAFLQFFETKGHTVIPSSSLVPKDDPTLLLTSAGMVQVKPYFLGLATPPSPRLASCQKCFRTSDIDCVGDNTHLTFFEMLGNFSVGDYFKKEAIEWAWEFVSRWLKLPPDRLWITVFLNDDEAPALWQQTGVDGGRIVTLGEEDNFWGPAGDSGPCGPCSEILYDFGDEFGCGKPECGPACDCGRFSEIWNLVFTQYDQDREGRRTPLPRPNIDTGMGLERVAAVVQGKTSVYGSDLFMPIVARVEALCGKKYGEDTTDDRAIRIVAEHGRAITFLIADGVVPGNEGRGYVLRRVLRRASLFGKKLGLDGAFLAGLADVVVGVMGDVYPELASSHKLIRQVVTAEEERFDQTLDRGLGMLRGAINYRIRHSGAIPELVSFAEASRPSPENASGMLEQYGFVGYDPEAAPYEQIGEQLASRTASDLLWEALESQDDEALGRTKTKFVNFQNWGTTISDVEVFMLYDTYGFPVELSAEIASERGFSLDLEGFEGEMEKQRERARAAHKFSLGEGVSREMYEQMGVTRTDFVGYEQWEHTTTVLGLVVGGEVMEAASEGDEVEVVLKDTPFYGEMGGQVGDTGTIRIDQGIVSVTQTTRPLADLVVHHGKVIQGRVAVGDHAEAEVDFPRRLDIARNHTATHLLQAALRAVLGPHVRQAGSLVAPDRFRFDFTQLDAIDGQQLLEVEHIVNEKIRQDMPVMSRTTSFDEAQSRGAIALFDEKYGETVRMVQVGDPPFSLELCGGTHVSSTGQIGLLHITSEGSIGSGMRRIEAVTGRGAERFLEQRLAMLEEVARELESPPEALLGKLSATLADLDRERKRAASLESELARTRSESLQYEVEPTSGVRFVSASVSATSPQAMREMGDRLKQRLESGVIVLGTIHDDRPSFVAMVTPDLAARGLHAGEIVKRVAKAAGGSGGGKAEMGQGSGEDKSQVHEALEQVRNMIGQNYDKDTGTWSKNIV